MRRFSLFLYFTIAFNSNAFADFFDYKVTAPTEEKLLEYVEKIIPQILTGKVRSVFHDNRCWPNNEKTIKIKSVHVDKAYAVDEDGKLTPYYLGLINYLHNSCRLDN